MSLMKHLHPLSGIRLLITLLVFIALGASTGFTAETLQNLYQTPAPPPKGATLFVAKEIITMSSHVKKADAVVVKDGRIIDVGNSTPLQ